LSIAIIAIFSLPPWATVSGYKNRRSGTTVVRYSIGTN